MKEIPTTLETAFDNLGKAEENKQTVWAAPKATEDEFADDIKNTAKVLMGAIKKSAADAYGLEPTDLAKLTKAVCDLQNAFYGKSDAIGNVLIQTTQLAMFKDMIK